MKLYVDKDSFIDTSEPIDLSMPLRGADDNPRAWYVDVPTFEPVRTDHYTGSVAEGGSVNFRNIFFNPHGHGTHTECLGHITKEVYSINKTLTQFFFSATVLTVIPEEISVDGVLDRVITNNVLHLPENCGKALVIRTMPNSTDKLSRNYSSTNPAFFDIKCVEKILDAGIEHLLIDLPSVDRESDEGKLAFHHAFWEVPENPNFSRTITELIYVSDEVNDGDYILNFQVAPFENDASPSRPVLYAIKKGADPSTP